MSNLLKWFAYIVATFLVYAVLAPILISAKSWVLLICGVLVICTHVFVSVWFVPRWFVSRKINDSSVTEIQQ